MKSLRFLIILLGIGLHVQAQDQTSLWANVGVKKKLNKHWAIQSYVQGRYLLNPTFNQTKFFELGLERRILKNLDFALYYRNISRKKNETADYKKRHRFYADVSYDKSLKNIKFEYRLRYQHQFRDNTQELLFDASYLRHKMGLSYNRFKKVQPYANVDFFYLIQNKLFDQARPKIGVDYKLHKNHAVDISLFKNVGLKGELSSKPIVGFAYKFKF